MSPPNSPAAAMPTASHLTLDVTAVVDRWHDLHARVTEERVRIEVTRGGCDDRCVIISKAELDSLEHALEIFSQTDGFQEMCAAIQDVVNACHPVPPQPQ